MKNICKIFEVKNRRGAFEKGLSHTQINRTSLDESQPIASGIIPVHQTLSIMRKIMLVIGLLYLLALSSCLVSLYPIYTEKTRVFVPGLVGTWQGDTVAETWIFEKQDEMSYLLKYIEKGDTADLTINLAQLNNTLLMDFYLKDLDVDNDLVGMNLLRVHTFGKLVITPDSLQISMMNYSRIAELIEKKKLKISYETVDNDIVLTAKPEELQKFVVKNMADPALFGESLTLKRIR